MSTLVGFLACVGSDVNCKCTSLNEALSTTRCHARVWSLVGMNPIMSLEIRLAVEALWKGVS